LAAFCKTRADTFPARSGAVQPSPFHLVAAQSAEILCIPA